MSVRLKKIMGCVATFAVGAFFLVPHFGVQPVTSWFPIWLITQHYGWKGGGSYADNIASISFLLFLALLSQVLFQVPEH